MYSSPKGVNIHRFSFGFQRQIVRVNVESMSAVVNLDGGGKQIARVRRLSTRSYSQGVGELFQFTFWCWYWEDHGNVWTMYDMVRNVWY